MRRSHDYWLSTVAIVSTMLACSAVVAQAGDEMPHSHAGHGYKHVLLISVDGMHAVDLTRWVGSHPKANFAKLANRGVIYPNAYTTAPSDSFPGMLAQVTGGAEPDRRAAWGTWPQVLRLLDARPFAPDDRNPLDTLFSRLTGDSSPDIPPAPAAPYAIHLGTGHIQVFPTFAAYRAAGDGERTI